MPIYCGLIAQAPLIANLRGHFAEFLNHRSPERLRILFLPTCVSFSTVNLALTLRSFSWTSFHSLRDLKCPRDSVLAYAWRICLPSTLSEPTDISSRTAESPDAVPPSLHKIGNGILTVHPSSTPFGLD